MRWASFPDGRPPGPLPRRPAALRPQIVRTAPSESTGAVPLGRAPQTRKAASLQRLERL